MHRPAITQPNSFAGNGYHEEIVPTLAPWPTKLSVPLRTRFFVTGVVFPTVCFLSVLVFGLAPEIGSPWQSGDPTIYVNLLMSRPTFAFFMPILTCSMVCLSVWCVRPSTSNRFLIRFGIATGAVMAAIFVGLLLYTTWFYSPVFAVIAAVPLTLAVWLIRLLVSRARRFNIRDMLILTTVVAIGLAAAGRIPGFFEYLAQLLASAMLVIIGAAPCLAWVTYCRVWRAAWFIHQREEDPTSRILALSTISLWLAGFFVTWKFALDSMMLEYSRLPTTDPNCFISSAAAYGHHRLVRSVASPDAGPVNLQMKRLKFLELTLVAASPPIHHWVRRAYNRMGPRLASICRQSAWSADAAFLAMKPFEWLAIIVQRLADIPECRIAAIYASNEPAELRWSIGYCSDRKR